jgi:hypothetical protein
LIFPFWSCLLSLLLSVSWRFTVSLVFSFCGFCFTRSMFLACAQIWIFLEPLCHTPVRASSIFFVFPLGCIDLLLGCCARELLVFIQERVILRCVNRCHPSRSLRAPVATRTHVRIFPCAGRSRVEPTLPFDFSLLSRSRAPTQWRRSSISPLRFYMVALVPAVRSRGNTSQRIQFVNSSFDLGEDFLCELLQGGHGISLESPDQKTQGFVVQIVLPR